MPEIKQCTLQIEELRIGNLVNYKGKPVRVDIHVLQEIRGNNCDYTPIELTGEVLQKCRVEKVKVEYPTDECFGLTVGGKIHFFKDAENGGILYGHYDPIGFIADSKPLLYLHILQNVIHSLTGQELKVNITL